MIRLCWNHIPSNWLGMKCFFAAIARVGISRARAVDLFRPVGSGSPSVVGYHMKCSVIIVMSDFI